MYPLRQWQSECVDRIFRKYSAGGKHFLAVATPGAGKTIMAAHVAKKLLDSEAIDFVLIFSPSVEVSNSFAETISESVNMPCDGMFGSIGRSLTYHSLGFLSEQFWELLDNYRVLVICDEIHHCTASSISIENMWGKTLHGNVYEKAAYTLSLSGTPWRSDQAPVALAEYCPENSLKHDYIYGLQEAIHDGVCRQPRIVSIDSRDIVYSEGDKDKRHYEAIRDLIENEEIPYQNLLEDENVISFMLEKAISRLAAVRVDNPDAAGLIVASDVKHAQTIYELLIVNFQQSVEIVTYHSDSPSQTIQNFKSSNTQWIVSVGMISEGTNIPRLQVCCHLSRIKTELHFRQVLGRILRVTSRQHPYAYLYILAEEKLLEYAQRIEEDLPEESVLIKASDLTGYSKNKHTQSDQPPSISLDDINIENNDSSFNVIDIQNHHLSDGLRGDQSVQASFQRFYEEILKLQKCY